MTCAEVRHLLHAHLDGELDLARELEVEQHVRSCSGCAAARTSLQSLSALLRNSDLNRPAPESLKRDVRQFVRDLNHDRPSRPAVDRPWLWKVLAFGAAAFALVTLFLRPAGMSDRDALLNELVACHVRSLQADHLTDVASSDQHTVKPWFDGKVDFAPDVRDFAAENFPLVGGRVDYLRGRAVAALVYRHNQHLINVFIWPATGSQRMETTSLRGYSIIRRDTKGLRCCLVSDLNRQELSDLAELLGR